MTIDPQISIVWVDSDPNIYRSTGLFQDQNWNVICFNETVDALNAVREKRLKLENIKCVITSMMERDGRRERGLLNGLQMLDDMKIIWKQSRSRYRPLMVVNSLTADVNRCKEHGVDIVVAAANRNIVQKQVIDRLNTHLNRRVILIGIAGPSGCGKTTYAKHLSQYLGSPIPPISLDNFFTKPIYIDHPILGRIKSLEQPETLNINGFMISLRQIKHEWATTPVDQLNPVAEKSNPIYIVVEGFLLFALSNNVTSMFDIRIFLDSTQTRCRMQRFRRDTKVDPALSDSQVRIAIKFSEWFDNLVWAEYLQRRALQIANAEKVFKPEEYQNNNYTILDAYIGQRLGETF
ncbi:unnamed protein product [Rotaria magnacalcarata]|uniref:Phosphoribulokinase/uridine kinase domain-containing protein n=1 Tax=Rotaria magnacalcarata TaxID=392030 RepID=A0A819IQJ8_9BILA|nr:unnamed protein product [Rotaria magnacalcarata]CAF3921099.1 unnamed protein product [Rotaria magnacalcarata]